MTEVQPRHLQQALQSLLAPWIDPANFAPDWAPNPVYDRVVAGLYEQGVNHPDVVLEAKILAASEAMQARFVEQAGGAAAFREWRSAAAPEVERNEAFDAMVDGGWQDSGLKPSEMLAVFVGAAGEHGQRAYDAAVQRGRDRYRQGFHADPFAAEPVRREPAQQ